MTETIKTNFDGSISKKPLNKMHRAAAKAGLEVHIDWTASLIGSTVSIDWADNDADCWLAEYVIAEHHYGLTMHLRTEYPGMSMPEADMPAVITSFDHLAVLMPEFGMLPGLAD